MNLADKVGPIHRQIAVLFGVQAEQTSPQTLLSWTPEKSKVEFYLAKVTPLLIQSYWLSEGTDFSTLALYLQKPLKIIQTLLAQGEATSDVFIISMVGAAELFCTRANTFSDRPKQVAQAEHLIEIAHDLSTILTSAASNPSFLQQLQESKISVQMIKYLTLAESVSQMLKLSHFQGDPIALDDLNYAKMLVEAAPDQISSHILCASSIFRLAFSIEDANWNQISQCLQTAADLATKKSNLHVCACSWDLAFSELASGSTLGKVRDLIAQAELYESKLKDTNRSLLPSISIFGKKANIILCEFKAKPDSDCLEIFEDEIYSRLIKNAKPSMCDVCQASPEKLFQCQKCKSRFYCGTTCQKKDWASHKGLCRSLAK